MATTVSIIVVALNEAKHLPRLAAALSALRKPADVAVETILVDGGSNDGTATLAGELGFGKVVEMPGASIPVCRNRGLREAGGDWVAFLDGDCEPAPGWLEAAALLLGKERRVVLGWPVEHPSPATWVQATWHLHWTHKNPRLEDVQGQPAVRHEAFRLVTTRNMLMTRAVLEAVPSFDESLPTGEDTDFVFRAQMAGVTVLGLPALKVVHHGEPSTLSEFFRQQLWHANRSAYSRIAKLSGGRVGAHAAYFTIFFALALAGLAAGVFGGLFVHPLFFLLAAPFPLLVAAPAAVIALRARRPSALFPLTVLYAAYGLARTLDLVGLGRRKTSWKRDSQVAPV